MKTLKTIKLTYALALMSCVLAIVFCVTGNPFDAILTLKSAKRLNSLEYGGKMKITGVVFDRRASLYKAKLIDAGETRGFLCITHPTTPSPTAIKTTSSPFQPTFRGGG